MNYKKKIKKIDQLEKIVKRFKKEGKKIVTTNGVFDIIHVGHLEYFEDAKKSGDILIVGINTDKSVKALGKGSGRPFNKQRDRVLLLAALEPVDYVYLFDEKRPTQSLAKIKPDIHIKNKEYKNFCPEKNVIEKYGGRVIFQGGKIRSTSNLVDRIYKAKKDEREN